MKYEINYSPTWIIAEFVFCHCTATNIKNKSEIKIDIKRKTKNITLPKHLIDKSHKLRIPLTEKYKTAHFPGLFQALQ
jgi:hypothetical protein